jgi:hypothetical protein
MYTHLEEALATSVDELYCGWVIDAVLIRRDPNNGAWQ